MKKNTIPVIAFVGRSGCGKTTLLENVVPLLLQRNVQLAVIKHTWHSDIESDVPGTDTRKMWDAGVPTVVLVSADRIVHWQKHEVEPDLDEILNKVTGVDMIILEGFKTSTVPKIEVIRQAHYVKKLKGLNNRIAFVTNRTDMDSDLPSFLLDDYKGVADFLYGFQARFRT